MKKWKIAVKISIFLGCAACLLYGLTVLLKDKRVTFDYDTTRKVEGFYAEEKNSLDFVFVGSSQMFTSVVPTVLWEEYGITSYDFGANEQPMYLSYYYIKEALKYQKPKAIVLEVSYCKGLDYTHEGVHHINLDDLRMGPVKLEAIFDIIPKGERWPYIFELAKYHDTWTDLNRDSMKYIFADKHNPYKGYTPSTEGVPDGGIFNEEIGKITERAKLPELSVEYMEKIIDLCKEEKVDLVFLKTPNDHINNQPYYNTVADLAKANDIPYLNLNGEMSGQLHNHVFHAETITKRIGEWLLELYEVEDKRENPEYALWHEDAQYYARYKHLLSLHDVNNYEEFLRELIGKDYLVCIAVNQDAGAYLSDEAVALMNQLGAQANVSKAGGMSYLAVLENGFVHAEAYGEEPVAYENRIYGHRISVLSQGSQAGCSASIVFDGEEYAPDEKGFNIVIYDPKLDKILTSKSFEIVENMPE